MSLTNHSENVTDWQGGVQVAENDPRLVKNVALLGATSANGYTYAAEAMQQAAGLYNNRPVFLDHDSQKHSGRKPESLAGKVENARFEGGRIRGDIRALNTPSGNTFLEIAKANVAGFGMSHVVLAQRSADGKTVERIEKVISVDAVHNPATTTSFKESAADPPQPPEPPQMTLEQFKQAHPDLVTQIEQAAVIKTKAELNTEAAATAQKTAVAQAVQEGVLAERNRISQITALCTEAKLPALAEGLCKEGKTIEEARQALFTEMCKRNPAPSGDAQGDTLGEGTDPDKKFRKEYADGRAHYLSIGISEAEYVRSRRFDEGLDIVKPGSAVTEKKA